ncbi:hypothetical protein B0H67DRAFT_556354 [Lasiosphaeris hirsuta]|uniref:Uncharacterized protein n=1 Tax=Lasiosphaeris hirsuta TaxID=260670 RepID=A0AA40DLM1_9PEZI|nr:hypothetical protein B0H67DRAFT_556354 [Lasiosphaeris hirsuta]
MFSQLVTVLGLAALGAASPAFRNATLAAEALASTTVLSPHAIDCERTVQGLTKADCRYLSSIGFTGPGSNPSSNSAGKIWLGSNGPNIFTFANKANTDVVLVLWDDSNSYASSFVTQYAPKLTVSIAAGGRTTISLANGVTGAWSAVYRGGVAGPTKVSANGQVENTWGEFTTGEWATVDVSRLITMSGNQFSVKVGTGCQADNARCAYVCKSGSTCWLSGSYDLIGCKNQPNNNAWYGGADPEGGCAGWSNGGKIDVEFL